MKASLCVETTKNSYCLFQENYWGFVINKYINDGKCCRYYQIKLTNCDSILNQNRKM